MEKPSMYDPEGCQRYIAIQKEIDARREEGAKRIGQIGDYEEGISMYNLDQIRRMRDNN